jgi:tetratricopeptide (TPR) repeat protein
MTLRSGTVTGGAPQPGGQPVPSAVVNTQVVNSSGSAAQAGNENSPGSALGPGMQQGAAVAANATGKAIAMAGYAEKLVENSLRIKANSLKGDLSEAQAKIEFQSLLVQLFLQRRFHHVIIGTRFHRALFGDGESRLNLPESAQGPFKSAPGLSPTVASLEALSNEAMRDVQTSVQAFHKLIGLGELRSASERLRDALLIGEFLPEVRTLPFERKRLVLRFAQKSNELLSALEVKDYTTAVEVLNGPGGLRAMAPDFDASKPAALIETARNAARLHLGRARNAAISGDKTGFETALKEAAAIWPNNPELQEVATKAFNQGDQMAQTLVELDQLLAQKNLRRIAEEPGRFLAAAQGAPPEKQALVKKILQDFKNIEAALMAAKEMDRQGNPSGAWESVDKAARDFPDDLQLNQARALYTTKAADFVRTIQNAQDHENRSELATGLAWYLKAQRLYPKSDTAEEAVQRIKALLLPKSP